MATAANSLVKADHFLRRPAPPSAARRTPPPIGRAEAKAGICHAGNRRKVGAGGPGPSGLLTAASRQDTLC